MDTAHHDDAGLVRGLGIVMDADFAPPKHSADYEARPLPAIPPRTSFSIPDMKAVFKTSKNNLTNRHVYDWDRQVDDISLNTDCRTGTPRSRSLPENDGSSIPTTPSNEILSPQPRHSRQKILRLTGNISPSMALASFEPSQHNSQQKIKQITGLDVGPNISSESPSNPLLHPFQDEVSPVSPSESTYSVEGLEATISEPDSEFSDYTLHSDANGVTTQLTAPSFSASPSRPVSTGPESPPTKVRLSSFAMREPDTDGQREPLTDFKAHYRRGSNSSFWASSRKSSATVVPHYASGSSDTIKFSPRASVSTTSVVDAGLPSPLFKQRSLVWDNSPVEHQTAETGHDQASPSSSPSPPHASSTSLVNVKPASLSDRRTSNRGRVPPPLEPNGEHPVKPPRKFSPPQRTPYPPLPPPPTVNYSAFDADSDDGKRTSFLGKVFRGGANASSHSITSSYKRRSRGPPTPSEQNFVSTTSLPCGGGGFSSTTSPLSPPPIPESHPQRPQGRDTPRSSAEGGGARGGSQGAGGRPLSGGAGLFQRARQSVGLRSRSEKRRNTLKGKIGAIET
ncbi:hypothetical protein KVR01_005645 [Diaporthe batatas]|uniref:uncharacterized protein n=1 Tax=Diaporthe batatas TaxID=748121 RepID=UPI001D0480B8|nr:uncharacterized protein KVR01_005645 [Diaporthe batatas]KAG8165370.1 hypothetical protein KVR01_005645 [Diaporthe batatas]